MTINFHHEAASQFESAQSNTRDAARPVLEMLSTCFQVTWFRETGSLLWLAVVKPLSALAEHFGLRQEYFVIGNGYANDFHQRTLKQNPPESIVDRLDQSIRFVVSDAPTATAFCAAWAQKNRSTVIVLRSPLSPAIPHKDHLYSVLSGSLWRRDFFAEAEPVRDPSEFFGREFVINELFTKILLGSPVAVFGLRKIGKSSLLGRVQDLIEEDESAITATAFLIGNSARLKSGRWWSAALDMLNAWQSELQQIATRLNSKVHPKAHRLSDAVGRRDPDVHSLLVAFERDVEALLKTARALSSEVGRDAARLVLFLDECDHFYPHLSDAEHWRTDFFVLWNALQSIKRRLDSPEELVYVLGGVNPSGVEQGSLLGQANPLYETQRIYLEPMSKEDADSLLVGLGRRMGLTFEEAALVTSYELVGGHPLLLRRLGSAIHEGAANRSDRHVVTAADVEKAFKKKKRDLFNQVAWFLEHLSRVAPDEERLLRDIATGGSQAYVDLWGDNDFRETYAYHLECYGLVRFENDLPTVSLGLIQDALQRPIASEFVEQKKQLKDAVEAIEQAVRVRLRVDLERDRLPEEAVKKAVNAIPSDAKTRAMSRQELLDLGEVAGLGAVLDSLNWGDYEILFDKCYDEIDWSGVAMDKGERLAALRRAFKDAHLVRHNNEHALKEMIKQQGYSDLSNRFNQIREMLSA